MEDLGTIITLIFVVLGLVLKITSGNKAKIEKQKQELEEWELDDYDDEMIPQKEVTPPQFAPFTTQESEYVFPVYEFKVPELASDRVSENYTFGLEEGSHAIMKSSEPLKIERLDNKKKAVVSYSDFKFNLRDAVIYSEIMKSKYE